MVLLPLAGDMGRQGGNWLTDVGVEATVVSIRDGDGGCGLAA